MSTVSIKIGDHVSATNEDLSGIVISVGAEITIETTEGFPIKFAPEDLVVEPKKWLAPQDLRGISEKINQDSPIKKPKKSTAGKKSGVPPMIVDLHIEKLVKHPGRLEPWQILDFQLDSAKNQLEWALNKRKQRIIFIHGIGEGVLKAELETLLRRYQEIRFYPANPAEFGAGAIEVYRLQNPK